jgi:hypothetical protein
MKSKKLVEDVLNLFQKTTFSLITELMTVKQSEIPE